MKWTKYAASEAAKSQHYRKFFNAINTDATLEEYARRLNTFMNFAVNEGVLGGERDYSGLAGLDADTITDTLEKYVINCKGRMKPITIKNMLAPVELFLEMNRCTWHKKLVRRGVGKNVDKTGGGKPITDDDLVEVLRVATHPRSRALVHFLASTGARVGSLVDPVLKMRHLRYMPDPQAPTRRANWCYSITLYEGSKEEYWAFLTPEATKALDSYFWWRRNMRKEDLDDESPVFASIEAGAKTDHMSYSSLLSLVQNTVKKSSIRRTKTGSRYDKARTYMFRKRFNGKMKMNNDVNSNIAEKLMAHKRGLDGVYLKPTMEECYAEFVKAIPALTVDPAERQKNVIEEERQHRDVAEVRNEELREQLKDMEILKRKVAMMEEVFGRQFRPKYEVDKDPEGNTLGDVLKKVNERDSFQHK